MGSRSVNSMSGANNVPLGQRAQGPGLRAIAAGLPPSSSGAASTGAGAASGSSSGSISLLKPSYLQQSNFQSAGVMDFNSPTSSTSSSAVQPHLAITNQSDSQQSQTSSEQQQSNDRKRTASEAIEAAKAAAKAAAAKVERKRKRKSRWAGEASDKTFIPGLPTMLPNGLTKEQEEAYLLQLRIEDTSRRLRSGDLGIPPNPEDRSPSPEPIYSSDGKRLNTREYRKRKELEESRHEAITRMLEINKDYKPPPDYKPPQIKVNDKVMIPQDDHPDINFVGLLIGPRGNTLKSMERETGAKIIIRGKGSVKEGKVGRKDGQPLPGEDEPLHAYVTASNPESVKKAVDRIKEIIRQGVDVPEGQNDLRKNQLRELALLNGTLREGEGPRCTNCGAADHKSWQCQDKPNVTNNVVCTTCGGVGHISKDCAQKRPGMGGFSNPNANKMDDEYMSLMAELGEGPPPSESNKTYQEGRITWGPARPPYTAGARPPRPMLGGHTRPPPPPPPANEYGSSGPTSSYGYGGPGGGPHPPPPPGASGGDNWNGSNKPPSLMQQDIPPPWQQGGAGNPRWSAPPGPPGTVPPPPPGPRPPGMPAPPPPNWGNDGSRYMPPPNFHAAPPPPPPPPSGSSGSCNGSNSSTSAAPPPPPPPGPPGSWNMPPWGGPPPPPPPPGGSTGGPMPPPPPPGQGPVPPPPPPGGSRAPATSGSSTPYWPPPQSGGWSGVPPPPPPPPPGGSSGSGSGQTNNLMSNLMAAPPPPPPPS